MKVVSHEEFKAFLAGYPRPLTGDKCGIAEPPFVGYYDFGAAEGLDALVASYHEYPNPRDRVYRIKETLA